MNGALDDFTGGLPPPASHVTLISALLQSLQHEFSCLVQEQRNSNFSLARMELRMAALEDEIRRLSNRVDLMIENRHLVEHNHNNSTMNQIETLAMKPQHPVHEPIQEASVSITLSNETVSNEESNSAFCLLDVTSCNDNINHQEILNLIPPANPIVRQEPNPIKAVEKKRSRKEHTPIRNTMVVVPTPINFQEPEKACSIIPSTLVLNFDPPVVLPTPVQSSETKKYKRMEKPKKRQRSSEEIPDEEIENLKNIIMREAAERAARQQLESNIEGLAEPERSLINEIIKKTSPIDGVSKPKNRRPSSEKSLSPAMRLSSVPTLLGYPFNSAIKLEVEENVNTSK